MRETFAAACQQVAVEIDCTYNFITFARIYQVVDTEQDTGDVFQPFWPYCHG